METLPWVSQGTLTSASKTLILIAKTGHIYFLTYQDWTVPAMGDFCMLETQSNES